MKFSRFVTQLLLAGTLAMSASVGAAEEKKHRSSEHKSVREALQRGEVLPLVKILAIASKEVPGDVIEVELDDEDKTLVYEIKILTSTGRVREVEIDARTGTVLKIEDD
ncbi:MAG: PepSY domain-containing protein [Steroidobacter sp.]